MQKYAKQDWTECAVFVLLTAAITYFMFVQIGETARAEDESEEAIHSIVEARKVGEQVRLYIPDARLDASGLHLQSVTTATYQRTLDVLATVVLPQDLTDGQHAYRAAKAEATRSQVAVTAAKRDFSRLKPLQQDGRIVSDKTLETAENAVVAEEASEPAAAAQLEGELTALRQHWGARVANWIMRDTAEFRSVIAGRARLVQLMVPAGELADQTVSAQLLPAEGGSIPVRDLELIPQTDLRLQGRIYIGVTDAATRILPGSTLNASVSVGDPVTGAGIPESAVVYWQGQSWVFIRESDGGFARHLVRTNARTGNIFVTTGLEADRPIVDRGGQLLLSEEMKAFASDPWN